MEFDLQVRPQELRGQPREFLEPQVLGWDPDSGRPHPEFLSPIPIPEVGPRLHLGPGKIRIVIKNQNQS